MEVITLFLCLDRITNPRLPTELVSLVCDFAKSDNEWYVAPGSHETCSNFVREKYGDNAIWVYNYQFPFDCYKDKVLIINSFDPWYLKKFFNHVWKSHPGKVVILSTYFIDECFSGAELEEINSRFKVIKMGHTPEQRAAFRYPVRMLDGSVKPQMMTDDEYQVTFAKYLT
jgi:hypothetical protein